MNKYLLFLLLEIYLELFGFCHNSRRFQGQSRLKAIFPIRRRRFSIANLKTKLERRSVDFVESRIFYLYSLKLV